MMGKTKIDWCDVVWNPVTGCTKVSEGCMNCYAERIAKRFWKDRPFSQVKCHRDRLDEPLHWRKHRSVFIVSMGDLFHPDVPDEFLDGIGTAITLSSGHSHDWMLLTKRPERMKERFTLPNGSYPGGLWLGVSAENQKRADERVPVLCDIPKVGIRFVSVEPMLEPVDLSPWLGKGEGKIHWVICGKETGPGARHFEDAWAMDLWKQCRKARIPFWWKNHPEYQERPESL